MASTRFVDEPHVSRIAEALWSRSPIGKAAVLVGAGFSRNAVPAKATAATMPGWAGVYTQMVEQLYPGADPASIKHRTWLLGQSGATSAYLRIAEEFESEFRRDALDQLILRQVPDLDYGPGDLHKLLVDLPWADVLTTNWDTLLERACETVEDRVYDVVRTVEEVPDARTPRVIKLHGSFPAHRPFIFTEEDFRTYGERFAPFVNLARQLTMENTLVLLGFSGDDPNFLYWSGWVRDQMGDKAPLIYLVGALDLSPSKRKMLEKRAVQPIDLTRLPDYDNWPAAKRHANAARWFLEALRAAEPYRGRRWPRPPIAPDPALQLVSPKADPRAPIAEPAGRTSDDAPVELARRHVATWRHNREAFPGWIVVPTNTRQLLWGQTERVIFDVLQGIDAMSVEERLGALYELNWRFEISLVPIFLNLDEPLLHLVDELAPTIETLDVPAAAKLRALAMALVRHAREEGEDALFDRWSTWLTPLVEHHVEERERLVYEHCLRHLARSEVAELEQVVGGWSIKGDPFWMVRKAGLLSDLGRDEEAARLSLQALTEIRTRTSKSFEDLASWSRESYAMLLRSAFLQGDLDNWMASKAAREGFDERQDLLASRGCDGKRDYFWFVEELAHVPPPLLATVERNQRFDIGTVNTKHRLAGAHPLVLRLTALQAIRFQEETGLPARTGHTAVALQILKRSVVWLIDVAPNRGFDAFLRDTGSVSGDEFEAIFSRLNIARFEDDQANRLFDRLIRLAEAALSRAGSDRRSRAFWDDRLKAAVEILSRLAVRLPERASESLELGLRLFALPNFPTRVRLGDEIRNIVVRSLEALPAATRAERLPEVFDLPLMAKGTPFADEFVDPAVALPRIEHAGARPRGWADVIARLMGAGTDSATRETAVPRLLWLFYVKLLDDVETAQLGEVLWDPAFLQDGLPGMTQYLPSAFIAPPGAPASGIDRTIKKAVLPNGALTDALVKEGSLGSLLARHKQIALSDEELLNLLRRFETWLKDHGPAPDFNVPFVGSSGESLTIEASIMFAELARRSLGIEDAHAVLERIVALDRYPVRLDAALPALVAADVLDGREAAGMLEAILVGEDRLSARLVINAFTTMVEFENLPEAFTARAWNAVALCIVARRPLILPRLLRIVSWAFLKHPERVPATVDRPISFGLSLILRETDVAQPGGDPTTDIFAARFWAAALAQRMHAAGRGEPSIAELWTRAAITDPLPDIRRAMSM